MPAPSALAAIAFDLGNVLIKVDHFIFCRRLAEAARLSPEEVYNRVFSPDMEHGYDTGKLSSETFYQKVMAVFQVSLPYPRFCAWWNNIFAPLEGMEELVLHLKAKYPLYLLSNTNPLHFTYVWQKFPIVHHFRRFILSYRVGSRKPEAGIYQALIRESGLPASQCLFIDDKPEFVTAAREQGLVAWQFMSPQDLQARLQEHSLW